MNLDRNIVIEAGAGTGKTYMLVQAYLETLFRKSLPIDAIVALTFTKKAAGEMKERIAEALKSILKAKRVPEYASNWGYRLNELQDQAKASLEAIDRANISTIHSYAYSLLKRFPLQAGLDPSAVVDEKEIHFDDAFETQWPRWLSMELSKTAPRRSLWLETLSQVSLSDIRPLARRLCDFDVPLYSLPLRNDTLAQTVEPLWKETRSLLSDRPEDQKSTRIAKACEEVLGIAAKSAWDKLAQLSPELLLTLDEDPSTSKAWPSEDISRLKNLKRLSKNLIAKGDLAVARVTELLLPFVARFRSAILAEGYLSNHALLFLANDLLKNHPKVRETLQREIRMILIDEFQDTDPLQGELLLFLAGKPGQNIAHWQEVLLEPGKLFIVGDPKQSIYRFRGADIAAYRQITDMVLQQGGEELSLTQSRRSHDQILNLVNSAFEQLIIEQIPISPSYQALEPLRPREDTDAQHVELRLAGSAGKQSSEDAQLREADDAATWIREHVGKLSTHHREEGKRPLKYRDVALVFRSAAVMRYFVDALRDREIPYVVEGERYFYSTPEVTDAINLLRVIDNPDDHIALVGFLRSPLGGFSDPELILLKEQNGLHIDQPLPLSLSSAAHKSSWALLNRLRARALREPLSDLLRHVYDDTFLLELAARSYHRDQTVANLHKFRRLLESFAEEGVTTLRGLLAKVNRFMEEDRLEGESPLADETYDAVRLMTIHKAKGLEFPIVWLPCLHAAQLQNKPTPAVIYDWSKSRLGLRLGNGLQNIDKFLLDRQTREREEAEEMRVLYVAMTRARERLILSGGIQLKKPSKSSFLYRLASAWGIDPEGSLNGETNVKGTPLLITRLGENPTKTDQVAQPRALALADRLDFKHLAKTWKEHEQHKLETLQKPLVLSPTSIDMEEVSAFSQPRPASDEIVLDPKMLGTLVHRFLEEWDFKCEKCEMPAKLRQIANGYFASLGHLREPFPDPKTTTTSYPADHPMAPLAALVDGAQRILSDFIGSVPYEDISSSSILGREIPFLYSGDTLMRGVIDVFYRRPDGDYVIADYKTDHWPPESSIQDAIARYRPQAEAYKEAIRRTLGKTTLFSLVFVRTGEVVTIEDPIAKQI